MLLTSCKQDAFFPDPHPSPSVGRFPKAEQQPFALEQCLPECRASMAVNLEIGH